MPKAAPVETAQIGLCWGTLYRASLTNLIEAAARHAFPTITVSPHLYYQAVEAGLTGLALRQQLRDAGVTVKVIDGVSRGILGLPGEPVEFKAIVFPRYDVNDAIEVAEALEAPTISFSADQGSQPALDVAAEAFGAMCREAAKAGRTIALEFVPQGALPTLDAVRSIAEACGEPNCKLMLDTWHMARTGTTPDDVRALPPGMIAAFQLNDRKTPPPDAGAGGKAYVPLTGRKLPGEGSLPLADFVAAALANNRDLTFEIEVFDDRLGEIPPDEAAAIVRSAVSKWCLPTN